MTVKPLHVVGTGAAACAACCATPLLGLPLLAGLGAGVAALACSGALLALVLAVVSVLVLRHRSRPRAGGHGSGGPTTGSVDLELTPHPTSAPSPADGPEADRSG